MLFESISFDVIRLMFLFVWVLKNGNPTPVYEMRELENGTKFLRVYGASRSACLGAALSSIVKRTYRERSMT